MPRGVNIRIDADDNTKGPASSAGRNLKGVGTDGERGAGDAERAFDDLTTAVDDTGTAAGETSGLLGGIGGPSGVAGKAALGVAGVAAAGLAIGTKLVGDLFDTTAEIDNLSKASGLSVTNVQILGRVAEDSGGDITDVADAAREMQLRLAEAAELGSGPAVDALDILGLTLEDVAELSADERFALIRDRLSETEDQAKRTFLAEELLGGATERLTEVISISAGEFDKLTDAAAESGRVFSEDQVDASEDARRAMEDAKDAIGGLVGELTIFLLPAVTALADFVVDTLVPTIRDDLLPIFEDWVQAGKDVVNAVQDVILWGENADDWLFRHTGGLLGASNATDVLARRPGGTTALRGGAGDEDAARDRRVLRPRSGPADSDGRGNGRRAGDGQGMGRPGFGDGGVGGLDEEAGH